MKHRAKVLSKRAQVYWLFHLGCVVAFFGLAIPALLIMIIFQIKPVWPVGWGAVLLMFAALLFDELRYLAEDEAYDENWCDDEGH